MSGSFEGASPSSNLMEVKDSEAQGQSREGLSEGSVEQKARADEQEPDTRHTEVGERASDREARIHQGFGL